MLLCKFKLKAERRGSSNGRLCVCVCVFVIGGGKKRRKTNIQNVQTEDSKKDRCVCVFLTIFVTGDRNVVDSSEFETGAGQNLELYRA